MKISYAQNFEDIMLWRALKGVKPGFYIDIGSHDPEHDSVTKLFYDRGWRGINVDADPAVKPKFDAARPRDTNIEVAVSDQTGEIEFLVNGGLSTSNLDVGAVLRVKGFEFEKIRVKAQPLSDLWDQHVPAGQDVHFLKVDVEGAEDAVLRSADFARHRPWIVVLEATVPATQVENWQGWEPMLTAANYGFVYEDGLNRFYLAAEHDDLRPAFRYPPNVFDGFVQARSMTYALEQNSFRARPKRRIGL